MPPSRLGRTRTGISKFSIDDTSFSLEHAGDVSVLFIDGVVISHHLDDKQGKYQWSNGRGFVASILEYMDE